MERYRERKKNLRLVFSCDASFIKVQDTRVVPALEAVMLLQLLMPCRFRDIICGPSTWIVLLLDSD